MPNRRAVTFGFSRYRAVMVPGRRFACRERGPYDRCVLTVPGSRAYVADSITYAFGTGQAGVVCGY